jgi:VanZ family protein
VKKVETTSKGRWQIIFRSAAICAWILLAVLSLVPGAERPHTGAPGNVEHAIAYALTGWVTTLALSRARRSYIAAALIAVAAMFEVCQLWIPGRGAAVDNWLASSFGAIIGVAAANAFSRFKPSPGRATSD